MLESLSRPAHIMAISTTEKKYPFSSPPQNKLNNKLLYTTKAEYLPTRHGQKLTRYSSHGLKEMQNVENYV
jgi:hypothetical protein